MRLLYLLAPALAMAAPQKDGVGVRLGLLATQLGVSPVGSNSGSNSGSSSGSNADFTDSNSPSGRVPNGQQCCCVSVNEQCGVDPFGGDDLVGQGFIDPRFKNKTSASDISIRIINRPVNNNNNDNLSSCPSGQKTCCYDNSIDLSVFGKTCISPQQANNNAQGIWRQSCSERNFGSASKTCGQRSFVTSPSSEQAAASPGEFPWTCLLLNQNNDFIGTCAIVPEDFNNNNGRGTRKVLTAAHKLSKIGVNDLLKVRVGEFDASGFNPPERFQHQEYTVVKILKHPNFNPRRLDNDLAILTVERQIDLSQPHINTVCYPGCDDQFSYRFNNGTGTRCWVAGWGKNENGQFQFIQKKVDLPIFERNQCNQRLKNALNNKRNGLGDRFSLHASEVCAGGEVGKDACTGDGGSPLVCQSQSGRWTVVGLVAWGVGCASEIPGVYARISYFRDWINAN
eukprot:TRINITY_DN36332_c0_g1_i1.p1 TRINITY_DN36332_c0_g1~~TRINITY_DN36332_c0_g1_i1.p1  ORF type:complete len:454 (-),score=113.52 TRINITY_DN36332_c0_g1_i1:109-1470(-)